MAKISSLGGRDWAVTFIGRGTRQSAFYAALAFVVPPLLVLLAMTLDWRVIYDRWDNFEYFPWLLRTHTTIGCGEKCRIGTLINIWVSPQSELSSQRPSTPYIRLSDSV